MVIVGLESVSAESVVCSIREWVNGLASTGDQSVLIGLTDFDESVALGLSSRLCIFDLSNLLPSSYTTPSKKLTFRGCILLKKSSRPMNSLEVLFSLNSLTDPKRSFTFPAFLYASVISSLRFPLSPSLKSMTGISVDTGTSISFTQSLRKFMEGLWSPPPLSPRPFPPSPAFLPCS